MSGYGQKGPLAHRAGHDLNYLARAGILGLQGHPEGAAPAPYSVQIADIGGALYGVIAMLAALHERNAARARGETWRGRVLDIALADSALSFALTGLAAHHGGEDPRAGAHPLAGSIAPYRVYETADGRFMALGALEPKFWIAFTQAVGLPSEMEALSPGPHQAGWIARVAEVFRAKTFAEWCELAARTDFCLEPVLEPAELANDPHWQARGVLRDGAVQTPAALAFARLRGTAPDAGPLPDRARAPAQGEHTAQILSKSAR
jgi:crotonobetainyl-CoA:carnitine CoA-transferase CaiB-like acyl-CoA transferase